ncbi:FMN-binding negative transcriptional regulator [Altibacter sp.]|uniref:FMN-binding negative transcriptional regulator n=1 Tax=Altibacter sp. TaxID=2024823 RepID=UPI000C98AB59|nr:FMN-binding negative transcriptional regulator [Altibacter sp.]MAP55163.1 transcriptional regulator [Altibacter sp.]
MYPPPYHQSQDIQKMIALIREYPLGMLVSVLDGKPLLTHIPIIYNETTGALIAHIDKNNPQIETLKEGAEVTVVFRGPDAYISPSVYTTEQLPTWNYIIVHVTGTVRLINDPEAAKETMIAMTTFLEGEEQRFVLHRDNERMDRAVNYIQAFAMTITHWEGKFKLSQDKIEADQLNAKHALIKKSGESKAGFINSIYS